MGVFVWPWFVGGSGGGGSDPVVNTQHVQGTVTVGITSVPARVGASNLANRKVLIIENKSSNIVYFGTSAVTAANGIAIYPNQVFTINLGPSLTGHLIAETAGNSCVVAELS